MQYLGESVRPRAERVCWFVVLVISLAVCLYSILDKWKKFENSPVIISFAETTTPIWQIPFPAVTVCSYTRSRATVFNYSRIVTSFRKNETIDDENQELFEAVVLMCSLRNPPETETVNKSAIDIIRKVGYNVSELISFMNWRNKDVHFKYFFRPTLTYHGVCYSFNMLSTLEVYTNITEHNEFFLNNTDKKASEWSLQDGYTNKAGTTTYPERGWGTGSQNGLVLIMDALFDDLDYMCFGPHQGFKVFIHNPTEVPSKKSKFVHVPLDQEVSVAVTPTMMTTSQELKDYTPERRQCHYPSSRRLRYFSVYTQANCDLECLTNYTLHMCDCAPYYMPHDVHTNICGPGSLQCIRDAEETLRKKQMWAETREVLTLSDAVMSEQPSMDNYSSSNCGCLPTCTDLQYELKVTTSDYQDKLLPYRAGLATFNTQRLKSRANVFLNDQTFYGRQRKPRFQKINFFETYALLLGIFLGFFLLSLVEISCFLLGRACRRRRHVLHDGLAPLAESDDTELEETKLHIP